MRPCECEAELPQILPRSHVDGSHLTKTLRFSISLCVLGTVCLTGWEDPAVCVGCHMCIVLPMECLTSGVNYSAVFCIRWVQWILKLLMSVISIQIFMLQTLSDFDFVLSDVVHLASFFQYNYFSTSFSSCFLPPLHWGVYLVTGRWCQITLPCPVIPACC